ncbi:hypothetical protein CFOL_v3_20752 [Cephalotus follicularis]|uniref:Retrotransposon gag domain-containing protein n=1 Tax=Cephalotus follicularis TaxID=3775 RepID=A0A1Q3CB09_CEPFO|nr:hypothetical protein CFOL_v3_20752 [Cephalotus follicularis]
MLNSRQPYPEYIDREHPFPKGYKVPEFTLFSGDDNITTLEHVARFTHQCSEVLKDDYLKLRLIPSSLTGSGFTCFIKLQPNSILNWYDTQNQFQSYFSRTDLGVSMSDLAYMKHKPRESAEKFLMRFKRTKVKCQTLLLEIEFLKLAKIGLDIELKKMFKGMLFNDLFKLSERATRYENILREASRQNPSIHGTYFHDISIDPYEVHVAEYIFGLPIDCDPLVKKDVIEKRSLGARDTGEAPGTNSITKSVALTGDNPGNSSGKMSKKSRTTGILSTSC